METFGYFNLCAEMLCREVKSRKEIICSEQKQNIKE